MSVSTKGIERDIKRRITEFKRTAKNAATTGDDEQYNYAASGNPVGKNSPRVVLDYVDLRGWKEKDSKAANLRHIRGELVAEIWPGTQEGAPFNDDSGYIKGETGSCFWPVAGLILPDPWDSTYAWVRVFFEVRQIGKGQEDPREKKKIMIPYGRGRPPYVPGDDKTLHDLFDPRKPLYLIEGPFKAAIAARRGLACIGVNGCGGAKEKQTKLSKNASREQARVTIPEILHQFLHPGRSVCLVTDADIATNLMVRKAQLDFQDAAVIGFDCKPFLVELPILGDGKTGADDYFAAGNTLADFKRLPRHQRDSKFVKLLRTAFLELTELGLAERFVVHAGDDYRHDPRIGQWFSYTEQGYCSGAVEPHRRMIEVVKSLDAETEAAKSPEAIKARRTFRNACGKKSAVNAALGFAAMDKGVDIDAAKFDADQDLIGTHNGVLRLSTGKLLAPSRDLMVTKRLGCTFDPKAKAPQWLQFVHRICDGQKDLMSYLQEIAGSCLAGRSARQEVFFFYGEGSNGKSVYIEMLNDLLGDYSVTIPAAVLLKSKHGKNPEAATPFLITLHGARLATCSELDEGTPISETMLKDLNGGDLISGRENYGDAFQFRNTSRLLVRCNDPPTVVSNNKATWDRVKLVLFTVTIPDAEQDLDFRRKLAAAELPGILQWAYAGYRRLAARNFRFDTPVAVQEATNKLRVDSDTIGTWLTNRVQLDPLKGNSIHRELQAEITADYVKSCEINNNGAKSGKNLWKELRRRLGYEPITRGDGGYAYAIGFTLKRTSAEITFLKAQSDVIDKLAAEIKSLRTGGEISKQNEKIKELEADLAAIKAAGRTTPSTSSGKNVFSVIKGGKA